MDLTSREEYWIKLCMKLIAAISHENEYNQFLMNDYFEMI
jgi:hypothetical protein